MCIQAICPTCGAIHRVPDDASGDSCFCPNCGDLLEVQQQKGQEFATQFPEEFSKLRRFLKALPEFLWHGILPGTNFSGLLFFVAVAIIMIEWRAALHDGVTTLIVGSVLFLIDWTFRGRLGADLFDYDRGARVAFLPMWIWGIIWMISGLVQLVI